MSLCETIRDPWKLSLEHHVWYSSASMYIDTSDAASCVVQNNFKIILLTVEMEVHVPFSK